MIRIAIGSFGLFVAGSTSDTNPDISLIALTLIAIPSLILLISGAASEIKKEEQ